MPHTSLADLIRDQAALVSAMEYLVEALTHQPRAVSVLNLGWVERSIPLWAIHRAKANLRIEAYCDDNGIDCWRLPMETQS